MSRVVAWCAWAESLLRCLTAVVPELGDKAFGRLLRQLDGSVDDDAIGPEGQWFRSAAGEPPGYIFIGPDGADHHFQADPPADVDPASMKTMAPSPAGLLWDEIAAALTTARALLSGEARALSRGDSPVILPAEGEERALVQAAASLLEPASMLRDPGANGMLLRQSMQAFMAGLHENLPVRLQSANREILQLRACHLADAALWAVAMLRQVALTRIVFDPPVPPLVFKLFDAIGPLSDPEQALRQSVSDLVRAGHGDVVMAVCDEGLARAEDAAESARAADSVRSHQSCLYEAAGNAYLAMRIAEIMRGQVAPEHWPAGLKGGVLDGYVAQTEEIVVRASEALAVACINEGSRAAFRRHRALVAALGPAKADELIEEYLFYPRAARAALVAPVPPRAS